MLNGQGRLDDTSESSCTLGVTNDGLDRADKELTAVILFLFREEHLLDGLRLNGCVSLVLSFRRALIFQQNSGHSNLWKSTYDRRWVCPFRVPQSTVVDPAH